MLLAACGDDLLLLLNRCVPTRRWRLLLLFSAAGSVASSARDALRMGAALLGVKRRITSVNYTRTNNQRGGLKPICAALRASGL